MTTPAKDAARDRRLRREQRLSAPPEGGGRRRRQGDARRPGRGRGPGRLRARAERGRVLLRRRRRLLRALRREARATSRSRSSATGPGRVVALGERECSLQRRHQKVLEECPSAGRDARSCARGWRRSPSPRPRSVDYVSAGTVEFLLAPDGRFFFLEMNTRIQVEHPVTEMVYGVDLVAEMIRIARGEPMCVRPAPEPRGPRRSSAGSTPRTPPTASRRHPGRSSASAGRRGPGIRVDSGVEEGDVVPLDYDPMVAKLVVCGTRPGRGDPADAPGPPRDPGGRDRDVDPVLPRAARGPRRPLRRTSPRSFSTAGRYPGDPAPTDDAAELALVAAAVASARESLAVRGSSAAAVPPSAWRTARPTFGIGNEVPREGHRPVRGTKRRGGGPARPDRGRRSRSTAVRPRWDIVSTPGGGFSVLRADGRQAEAVPQPAGNGTVRVRVGAERVTLELLDELTARAQAVAGKGAYRGSGDVKAAIPGRVLRVLVEPGDAVLQGQPVVVLEAMKMENDVRSPRDGVVAFRRGRRRAGGRGRAGTSPPRTRRLTERVESPSRFSRMRFQGRPKAAPMFRYGRPRPAARLPRGGAHAFQP